MVRKTTPPKGGGGNEGDKGHVRVPRGRVGAAVQAAIATGARAVSAVAVTAAATEFDVTRTR